jgi:hypothetical protein
MTDFEGVEFDFESEDSLPDQEYERKPVPAGTKATVRIRQEKDRDLGDFRSGESQYGPWMIIPFEVSEGEFTGEWASMIINLKTSDRKFRKVFEVVTGIDVSEGGKVSFDDFKDKLVSSTFQAELGPEKRKNASGDLEETGYTKVYKLEERVGDVTRATASDEVAPAAPEGEEDIDDEDVPF